MNDNHSPRETRATRPPRAAPCPHRVRHPSLSDEQVDHLRSIATAYIPDLADPAAAEVLLALLEVCRILRLSPARITRIFGQRALRAFEAWGDVIPAR